MIDTRQLSNYSKSETKCTARKVPLSAALKSGVRIR